MQHLIILATSEGQWVLPGTPEFFTALGDSKPDYNPLSFAVKNLGFVKLEVLDRSIDRSCRSNCILGMSSSLHY